MRRELVRQDGPGRWIEKAKALGTGRTAKALNTRWLRESGRIQRGSSIDDRSRGGGGRGSAKGPQERRGGGAANSRHRR